MRFRVELRSVAHEFRAIIREAVVVEELDAIDAAQHGRQTIANLYGDSPCMWRVESVIPLDPA
jgi:hypothetical protein